MDDIRVDILLRRWAVYLILALLIIFVRLIPIDLIPSRMPAPDLLLALSCALVIRKARYVPWLLAGMLFLLADILLSRPLGLWALLSLVAIEILRANRISFRHMFFLTEWLTVSALFAVMILVQQFILLFSLAPLLPMGQMLWQLGLTILCYPVIVLAVAEFFGLRKPKPGAYNEMGQPL